MMLTKQILFNSDGDWIQFILKWCWRNH